MNVVACALVLVMGMAPSSLATPSAGSDSLNSRRSQDNSVTRTRSESRHHDDDGGLFNFLFNLFFNDDDDDYTPVKSGRGSLADAMEKASDEHTGDRTVPEANTQYVPPRPDEIHHAPATAYHEKSTPWEELYDCLGLQFTSGSLKGGDYYGMWGPGGSVGLAYFKTKRPLRISAYAQYLNAPVQTTSGLHHSVRGGIGLLEWGVAVDVFTTPYYTFMGHYLTFGLGFPTMNWELRNTLTDASGDAIKYDDLDGVNGFIGMGWNPMQLEHFEVGFEARMGAIGWVRTTREGFHNDFFPTFKYVQIVSSVKYKWE